MGENRFFFFLNSPQKIVSFFDDDEKSCPFIYPCNLVGIFISKRSHKYLHYMVDGCLDPFFRTKT